MQSPLMTRIGRSSLNLEMTQSIVVALESGSCGVVVWHSKMLSCTVARLVYEHKTCNIQLAVAPPFTGPRDLGKFCDQYMWPK